MHGLVRTVQRDLHRSDVRLKHSVGLAVGMGNIQTEYNAFSANIALCHFETPPYISVVIFV